MNKKQRKQKKDFKRRLKKMNKDIKYHGFVVGKWKSTNCNVQAIPRCYGKSIIEGVMASMEKQIYNSTGIPHHQLHGFKIHDSFLVTQRESRLFRADYTDTEIKVLATLKD